ncbi:bifunctional nuclease family protein [Geotalea toluenoxydans]|uniref:bifunctional nuclease family protein n=1 Tax=Geotalea toluenoxydans TaxID=421624 RepID=UPI0006D1E98A|nr:bifunctional nuclease family protein [Geotalea toluenoxydans]
MYYKMKIYGFALDAIAQMPVIILKDDAGENSLPIWIGQQESVPVALELINRDLIRAGSGDLLTALMQQLELKIESIAVESLRDGVFNACVKFSGKRKKIRVEVRVTEALLTALKYKIPVMVHEDVVREAPLLDLKEGKFSGGNDARRFVDFLEKLDPATLGKYPM